MMIMVDVVRSRANDDDDNDDNGDDDDAIKCRKNSFSPTFFIFL